MDPITIITGLATVVPSIVKWIAGDKSTAAAVAEKAGDLAMGITGSQDPTAALELVKVNKEYAVRFEELWAHAEQGIQENLTRRHEADMKSDSWLAKNVRPMCLLGLTVAVMLAVFMKTVEASKLSALTELASWVFGYYFVGRSAFDKGAVKLDFSKK